MPEYSVTWTIDIDADTPVHAGFEALAVHRDSTSWTTVFTVHTDEVMWSWTSTPTSRARRS